MAIEFDERETSAGPLDVAKSAGDELSEVDIETSGESEPLDVTAEQKLSTAASDAAFEHQKNPLGYTVTSPTEEEIDGTTDVDETQTEPKAY